MGNAERLFTEGILDGYGSKTEFPTVIRGGVKFKVNHYESPELGVYEDQWTNGGGQESITLLDGKQYTRTYGGKTVRLEKLQILRLTEKDVIKYLISTIQNLRDKTRLHDNCSYSSGDENFRYEYEIEEHNIDLQITKGRESIWFNDTQVFFHNFTICPVN